MRKVIVFLVDWLFISVVCITAYIATESLLITSFYGVATFAYSIFCYHDGLTRNMK